VARPECAGSPPLGPLAELRRRLGSQLQESALPQRIKVWEALPWSASFVPTPRDPDAEIEDAARRFERLADNLDPASVVPEDLSGLRAVAEAAERVRRDEALVTERVAAARARQRSWNRIAVALGVSRQVARHRFADKVS
jgi:hypothetical protein